MEERVAALSEGLRAERPWRNVQRVLLATFAELAEILELQTRRLAAAEVRAERLERRQSELEQRADKQKEEEAKERRKTLAKWRSEDERRARKQVAQIAGERNEELVSQWGKDVAKFVNQAMNEAWPSHCREMELKLAGMLQFDAIEQKLVTFLKEESSIMEDAVRAEITTNAERLDAEIKALADRFDALKAGPQPPSAKQLEALALELEQGAIHAAVDITTTELGHLDERFSKQLAAWRGEIDRTFAPKVDRSELVKLLSRKMDTIDGWKQLDGKASLARLKELEEKIEDTLHTEQQLVLRDIQNLRVVCDSKADAQEFEQLKYSMHDLLAVAESMQHEMSRVRTTIEEVPIELNQQEMSAEHFSFPTMKLELQRVVSQLDAVKRQLRSEIYQARYIWKDGTPTTRQTITWNTQVLNTNADIFQWKIGSDRVKLLVPGLYYVQTSFFTNTTPTIHIRVNGEAVLSLKAPSPLRSTVPSPPIRAAGVVQRILHSAGNVAGLTLDGVLALPENALLSIAYDSHERAQGFLNLRKL